MTEHPAKKRKMDSDASDTEKAPAKKSPTTSPSPESDSVAPATSSPPTPAKYTRGALVTLLIGPDEQELVVCGTPLAKSSEFFQAALKKEWKEGQMRTVKLPEEDTELITRYLDFVFGQSLPSMAVQSGNNLEQSTTYKEVFELYTLGDRLLDASIRNAIVKETLRLVSLTGDEGHGFLPSRNCVALVYNDTPARSAARRLMVDVHIAYGLASTLEKEKLPSEYMLDMAKAYSKKIENGVLRRHAHPRFVLKAEDYFV